tara:strand:- start:170 stop:994 length:825 start_codon:yes stop_codon:yes gene_type:complete
MAIGNAGLIHARMLALCGPSPAVTESVMSLYRVPTGQRVAALRAGEAIPDEFERHYLAALARGATLENAAKEARAAIGTPATANGERAAGPSPAAAPEAPEPPEPPRIEDLDPPLDMDLPWYNPDPRHISSVRRVVRPAIWVTGTVLALQMIGTASGLWFQDMGLGYWMMLILMSVISGVIALLMMGAHQGSVVAAAILLFLQLQPILRATGGMLDELHLTGRIDNVLALGLGIVLGLVTLGLWVASATSLALYRQSLHAAALAASARSEAPDR